MILFGDVFQFDDGWRPDRDISIAIRPCPWAYLQELVEHHGTGRCLFRVRLHVQPRIALLIPMMLATSAAASGPNSSCSLVATAVAGGTLLVLGRIEHDIVRDTRQIVDVLAGVARDYGMKGLPTEPDYRTAA